MSRPEKSLLVGAAAVLLPIAIGTAWMEVVASRRWAETLKRTEEIEAELAAPSPRRPPLRGAALPGNAWDDYLAADALSRTNQTGHLYVAALAKASRENAPPPASPLGPAFARLRDGVRRARADRPPEAHLDFWLLEAARKQAILEADAGRIPQAFERLTDLVRVGLDATQGPGRSDGNWQALQTIQALFSLLRRPGIARADLEALIRDLHLLEESCPPAGMAALAERNRLVKGLQKDLELGRPLGAGWRQAWSDRIYGSRMADHVERFARSLAVDARHPWPDVIRVQARFQEDAAQLGYPLPAHVFSPDVFPWRFRADLRLARAAAHFQATGEKLALDDPFGGLLRWDDLGVRSRGPTDSPDDDLVLPLER